MYYIVDESTNKILYAPSLQNDSNYSLVEPVWTEEINKSGSLEFTIYPAHAMYSSYRKMTTIFAVKDEEDNVVWRGRVTNDDKDFYQAKNVYCEGQLAFLCDSIIRPHTFYERTIESMFNWIVTQHNSQVEKQKQFTFGYCDIAYKDRFVSDVGEYNRSLDEIQDMLDQYGGYILFDNNKIYYSSVSGTVSDQIIDFGENLLDLTESIDATGICTVLIPLGKPEEDDETNTPIDIKDVNGGKDYLENQNGIDLFGRIVSTVTFDDIDDQKLLKTAGENYLAQSFDMAFTIDVTAADLFDLGVDVDKIRCGNYYRVRSLPHGIDNFYQCTKITHHLENPTSSEYTFGATSYCLTDKLAANSKILNKNSQWLKPKKVKKTYMK